VLILDGFGGEFTANPLLQSIDSRSRFCSLISSSVSEIGYGLSSELFPSCLVRSLISGKNGVLEDVLVIPVLEHFEGFDSRVFVGLFSIGEDDDRFSSMAFRFLSLVSSILPRDASRSIGMKMD